MYLNLFRGNNSASFIRRTHLHTTISSIINIPLSKEHYEKELLYIYGAAIFNSYPREITGNIINKAKFNKEWRFTLVGSKSRQ